MSPLHAVNPKSLPASSRLGLARLAIGGLLAAAAMVLAPPSPAAATGPPTILRTGHTDIGPRMVDGRVRLQLARYAPSGDETYTWFDLDEVVFVMNSDGKVRLRSNPGSLKYGDPGDEVHLLPSVSTQNLLWPGFNLMAAPDRDYARPLTLTLDGVSGPGDFIIDGGSKTMSTRVGLPAAFTFGSSAYGHFHTSWVATKPGVYCLNLRLDGQLAGSQTPVRDRQQLTIVTEGAADLTTIVPCAERGPAPLARQKRWPQAASGGAPVLVDQAIRQVYGLLPELDGDALNVALVESSENWPGVEREARDVVFYNRRSEPLRADATRPWEGSAGAEVWGLQGDGSTPPFTWDSARLDPDRAPAGATVELTAVRGADGGAAPGAISLFSPGSADGLILSTVPGFQRDSYDLRSDSSRLSWTASAPGVYCVGLRWSATLAGGATTSHEKTLTLAIDEPRSRPSVIDPARVAPCERRLRPFTTTRLDRGHVDLASRVIGGQLDLSIADQTAADGSTVLRDPAGTVLGAASASAREVPAGYRFLAPAGTTAHVLPQVADPELLWPGWSTDKIPAGRIRGPVRWTLRDVRGPGHVALWTTSALEEEPSPLFSTRSALPQTYDIPQDTHAHASWGFTAPGVYCLDMSVATTRSDGAPLEANKTVTFAVGAVDPAAVTPGVCSGRPAPDPLPTADPGPGGGAGDSGASGSVPAPGPGTVAPAGPGGPVAVGNRPGGASAAVRPGGLSVRGLTAARTVGLGALRRTGMRFRVTPPSKGARVRGELTVSRSVARRLRLSPREARSLLAARTVTATSTKTLELRLRPSRATRSRLARVRGRGTVTATLRVTVTAADGRTARATRVVRLRL